MFLKINYCYSVSLTPNPHARVTLLVGYLLNTFAASIPIWKPTPQFATRGDSPCRGDKNPWVASILVQEG